jgi:hypothetical protein
VRGERRCGGRGPPGGARRGPPSWLINSMLARLTQGPAVMIDRTAAPAARCPITAVTGVPLKSGLVRPMSAFLERAVPTVVGP